MDVNGTRFHLVQGADWEPYKEIAGNGTISFGDEATLLPLVFQFPAPAATATADPVDARRGAARDRYGNWYWVDETGTRIAVRSVGSDELGDFWPIEEVVAPSRGGFGPADETSAPQPCRFGGLAITDDHYLIVGTLDQPGLLVFDLHAGGRPRHLRWPSAVPFQPFDMTPRPGGGVFALDRANRCYWALDRQLGVIDPAAGAPLAPETFRPASGQPDDLRLPKVAFPPGITLASSPLGAADPVAIEALPDGTVLILDRSPQVQVHRYRLSQHLGSQPLDLGPVLIPSSTAGPVLGADLAFVANAAGDSLYVPSANREQVYSFAISWQEGPLAVSAETAFLPMRLYGGKGLVSVGDTVWYDFDGKSWVPLVEQRRPRFQREGIFETPSFDGREPGCVWHRLFLDGCVPPTSSIEVWSRVADEKTDLEHAPWSPEPPPRRRPTGPELPLVSAAVAGTESNAGTFELLFQRARGRWLQLRFRLSGDGRSSPRLRALRIWYPRFSYLAQYLPATYRDDPQSASFLDRFLANLEGLFTSLEDRMAVAEMFFDARTAPVETLDWLGAWFGVALDPAWTEAKRRLFLRHAMDFFRTRGTVRGLQTALRLVIEDCPDDRLFTDTATAAPASVRVLEWYRLRQTSALALGDASAQSGIRQVATPPAWTPEQGAAALLDLYRIAARAAGIVTPINAFPVFEPGDGSAPLWHRFLRDVLSLSSTAGPGEAATWQAFLAARYPTIDALNTAWGQVFTAFSEVPLPGALPVDEAPLFDWYQFQLGNGRFIASGTRWIPSQGRDALSDRWRQVQHAAGTVVIGELPVTEPADAAASALWRQFTADVLGFVPAAGSRDEQSWRDFLARR